MSGETAWTKRTQGICQPAGSLARSQKLIQPRKRLDVKDDLVTSRGSQHRHSAPRQADVGFTGVFQDCGMVEEKRTQTNPRPPEKGAGLPRTREACAPLLLGNWQVTDDQRKEDVATGRGIFLKTLLARRFALTWVGWKPQPETQAEA